ncbi:uncharacterized protein LOC136092279 isoform X2 [Hydra vulgaris]
MIKIIIFWIVLVKYNEAFVDIADDLDFVGASGTFIPLSKNFETYDESSVRQYNPPYQYIQLERARTIWSLYRQIVQKLPYKLNRFKLFECTIKVSRPDNKILSLQPEVTCANLNIKKFVEKFIPGIKDLDVLSSGFIRSDILSIKEINVTIRQVNISVDFNGLYFARLFAIQNFHLNLVIPIRPLSKTETFSFTLSANVKNYADVKVEFKLPENHIAELSINFSQLKIGNLLRLLNIENSIFSRNFMHYNDLSFILDNLYEKFIDAEIKGLYNTSNKHIQLYAKVVHEYQGVQFSINFIFDVNQAKKMAFVVQLSSISSIFDALDKNNNFHIPKFIKRLIGNSTLTVYSKNENLTLLGEDFITINGKALTAVESGINIYIATQMKDIFTECAKSNRLIREKLKKSNLANRQSENNLTKRNTDYNQVSVKSFIQNYSQIHINQERSKLMQQPRIKQTHTSRYPNNNLTNKKNNESQNNRNQNNGPIRPQSQSKYRPSSQQDPQSTMKTNTEKYEDLVKIILTSTNVVIKLPKSFSENLDNLLSCFFKEIKKEIPYKVPDFLIEKVKKYRISELSFSNKEYKITIEYTEEINAPFDLVLKKTTFEVLLKIEKEKTLVFKGHAEIYFTWSPTASGEIKFTFDTSSNITLDINLLNINTGSFSSFIGNQNNLGHYITKFKDIAVKSIIISGNINLKSKKGQIILSASAVIHKMPDATLTLFIWNYKKLEIALGLMIKKVNLSEALNRFGSIDMSDSWFNDAQIAMLLSNAAENSKPTELKLLNDNSYPKEVVHINELRNKIESGFLVEASYEFKETGNWEKNAVLKFLFDHGVRKILLKGKIGIRSIRIEAHIETDISLHDESGLSLKNISLVLNIESSKKEMFLKILFKMKTPDVVLQGTVKLSQSGGLELSAFMKNMVYKPFGLNWLAIGNLFVSFGFKKAQLQVKAEVWLGNITSSPKNMAENTEGLFKFDGFIGISFKSKFLWFLYFKRTGDNFTIETILKALGFRLDLPDVIAKTGFIGESIVSISLLDQKIDDFDMTIPHGLFLKGCLSIFNYRVAFEINVSLKPLNFSFTGWFDRISLGGISMYRSSQEPSLGPILHVQVSSKVNVYIEASVCFFGIQSETKIIINDKQLYFGLHNNLFGVLKTNLKVEADYTSGSGLSNFRLSGSVESKVLTDVTDFLKNKFSEVKEHVNKMKETVSEFFKTYGTNAIKSSIEFLNDCKRKLENKLSELNAEEKRLENQRTQGVRKYEKCLKECQEHKIPECSFSDILGLRVGNCLKKLSFAVIEDICNTKCKGFDVFNYASTKFKTTAIKVLKIFPSTALGFLNIVDSLLYTINMIFDWALSMKDDIENITYEMDREYTENKVDSCKVTNISMESEINKDSVDTVTAQIDCGTNNRTLWKRDASFGSDFHEVLASGFSQAIVPQTEKFWRFQDNFAAHKDNVAADFNI